MSGPLLELLRAHPTCRVTICRGSSRRKPQSGDVKVVRGKRYVRQQVMTRDGYHVRNGRPVYEWVPEDRARDTYRSGWVMPKRKGVK